MLVPVHYVLFCEDGAFFYTNTVYSWISLKMFLVTYNDIN
jgi:hypothetical protein